MSTTSDTKNPPDHDEFDEADEFDQPTTSRAPAPEPDERPIDRDAQSPDLGTPLGQMVVGGLLVSAAAVWLLYRFGGWTWVLIGLAVLVAVVLLVLLAPMAWRRWRSGGGRSASTGRGRQGSALGGRPWSSGRSSGTSVAGSRGRGGVRSMLGQLAPSRRAARSTGAVGARPANGAKGPGRPGRSGPLGLLQRGGRAMRMRSPSSLGHTSGTARPRGRVQRALAATRTAARSGVARLRLGDRRLTRATQDAAGRAATFLGNRSGRARAGLRRALQRARSWDEHLTGGLAAVAWSWWRRRRGQASATAPETSTTDDTDTASDQSEDTTHGPSTTHRTTRSTTTGGTMSEFPLISHATELPTIAAGYESDDMMDVRGHMQMLRELPLAAGTCIRIWTERLAADYPLNQDAAEALQRVYDAFGSAVEACDEAAVVFEGSHDADIQRHLAPRTNEHKWNNRR